MKILVLGAGAREHAIVKALIRTGTAKSDLIVAPGNAGIAGDAHCEPQLNPNDPLEVTKFALEHKIELAIIGPEAPLVAGVSDALRDQHRSIFLFRECPRTMQSRHTFTDQPQTVEPDPPKEG